MTSGETVRIGVVHGPNLSALGTRQPDIYGTTTLGEIDEALSERAAELSAEVLCFQANGEGQLIDWIHARAAELDGWLINAGAYTHSSLALLDALMATGLPFVEVHLTNIYGREPVRRRSFLAEAAVGVVAGFGAHSYLLGLEALVRRLRPTR